MLLKVHQLTNCATDRGST